MERYDQKRLPATHPFLVTGATSGIGLETALGLVRRRIPVIGIGRNPRRCAEAEVLLREAGGADLVSFETADLSLQAEIRAVASRIGATGFRLRGIIHNAGTFCLSRQITADGVERQFAVNYLAGFLLVRLLRPLLSAGSRVLLVSSGSHLSGRIHWNNLALRPVYNGLAAYAQSKLAEVLFSYELDRRSESIDTYAVDPGLVNTGIGFKEAGAIGRAVWALRARGGISAKDAAAPIVELAASNEAGGRSGLYWKDGSPLPSSKRSYDRTAAERLWELSEQLCGLAPLGA
jgi:NAD(P)-dependent dehydrogenase (short-subunit alcohol dehydrogenase family)